MKQKHIGEFVRTKFRAKRITDPELAKFLSISKSAVEKIYPQDDIYISRLIQLSVIANEDLFEFYYDQEPLKSLRGTEIKKLKLEIEDLKSNLQRTTDHIKNIEHMNFVQQQLIDSLTAGASNFQLDSITRNKKEKRIKASPANLKLSVSEKKSNNKKNIQSIKEVENKSKK